MHRSTEHQPIDLHDSGHHHAHDLHRHNHDLADLQNQAAHHHNILHSLAAQDAADLAHFQPDHAGFAHVTGDPSHFMPAWHWQTHNDTCAVVSQEFILHSFGLNVTEDHLARVAHECGFYNPGQGTPLDQTGSLLEAFGLTVHREHSTMDSLVRHMEHGDKVIVGVDCHRIWHDRDELRGSLSPPSANHAVQVIGVADYGTDHAKVILNDPGAPDGCGKLVPFDDFTAAWGAGGNFMAYVSASAIPTLGHAVEKLFPALASYAHTNLVMYADPTAVRP